MTLGSEFLSPGPLGCMSSTVQMEEVLLGRSGESKTGKMLVSGIPSSCGPKSEKAFSVGPFTRPG